MKSMIAAARRYTVNFADNLKLYGRYLSISIQGQMQYRASFIMQSLGHFLITGFEFVAIWALFSRFGNLRGWTLPEVAVFYGLISTSFSICDALTRGFDIVSQLIKEGTFDRMLLRPRATILQLMGYEFTLRRVGRFSQGVLILVLGAVNLGVPWGAAKVLLLFWIVLGGGCLFTGILLIQATISFWTTESLEIMNTLTYGGMETAQYPMSIYLSWFRRFFTFVVPLACVNYYPVLAVLEKADPLGSPPWIQPLTPAAGVIFLFIGLLFWRFGLRHYSSTGS